MKLVYQYMTMVNSGLKGLTLLCSNSTQEPIPGTQVYLFLNCDVIFQIDPRKQPLDTALENLAHSYIIIRALMWHCCKMTPMSF